MPVIQPARNNNFAVLLWDVQGPAFWGLGVGDRTAQIAADIVGGLIANLSSSIFGGFTEVQGLDAGFDVESYSEGGNNYSPLHFHRHGKFTTLTLKRGATTRTDLWDWHQQVMDGRGPAIRKSGVIIMFDRGRAITGNADVDGWLRVPLGAWYVDRAIPEKVEAPTFRATAEEVAYETVVLRHQGVTRVSIGMIPGAADLAAAVGGVIGLAASGAQSLGAAGVAEI